MYRNEAPNKAVTPPTVSKRAAKEEIAQPFLHVDREHAHSPWKRVPALRASTTPKEATLILPALAFA